MGSNIVNPAAGNVYFDTAGSAISAQPTINTGRAHNIGTADDTYLKYMAAGSTNLRDKRLVESAYTSGISTTHPISTTGYMWGVMTEGRYLIRRGGSNANYIAGVASTSLRSAASDYGLRSNPRERTVIRGPLTATAIRSGYWSISGVWTTAVTSSINGIADLAGVAASGSDDAANPTAARPGEFVYQYGSGGNAVQADYPAKTTW